MILVAGIIVGPHTPGPIITTHVEGVRSFTELGVVLLLFVVGLEIRPSRLWALRREIFGLGSLQIILTASAVTGYALLNHWPWKASLIIGMTMAVSSTALVMQILQDKGEIASPHGGAAFGVLLMQDLAISVSFLLAQGGEFGFVLLTSAKALAVIDNSTFVMGIGVISVGMLFTPLMAKLGDYVASRLLRKEEGVPFLDKGSEPKGRVIVGGYGRVGHVVAVLLHTSRVPYMRSNYPGIPVIARARDLEASGRLIRAGATLALPEALESSLRLANDALRMVGVPVDNVDLLLSDVRRKDYELVDPGK